MITTSTFFSKFAAAILLASTIYGSAEEPSKREASKSEANPEAKAVEKEDPIQNTIDRLILGKKIPEAQLVKELEGRDWAKVKALILASIKKRSQEPNWTKEAQKKAAMAFRKLSSAETALRRRQSLKELGKTIQKAVEEEAAGKK